MGVRNESSSWRSLGLLNRSLQTLSQGIRFVAKLPLKTSWGSSGHLVLPYRLSLQSGLSFEQDERPQKPLSFHLRCPNILLKKLCNYKLDYNVGPISSSRFLYRVLEWAQLVECLPGVRED